MLVLSAAIFCYKLPASSIDLTRSIKRIPIQDTVYFDFIVMDRIYYNSNSYIGEDYEFNNFRINENDSVFIEKNFYANDSTFYRYKLSFDGKWYIYNKKWEIFFSKGDTTQTIIRIADIDFTIKYIPDSLLGDSNVYLLNFIPPKTISVSHSASYLFHIKMGLIGVVNYDGIILIRKDYLEWKNFKTK